MKKNLILCKSCGAEIAKDAKTCPQCGAKNKRKHPVLGVLLVVFGLALIAFAIGGKDQEPHRVDASPAASVDASQPAPSAEAPTAFSVGEVVELNDIQVTLTGVTQSSGSQFNKPGDGNTFLLCSFLIENNSDKEIAVSSLLCFDAYIDDFSTSMSLSALLESDEGQLDGKVAAGKKMSGAIGYEAPADWSTLEVKFTPDFWSGKDITFIAASEDVK